MSRLWIILLAVSSRRPYKIGIYTCAKPVHLAIFVAHRVIILDTVRKQQLCSFTARLPPRSNTSLGRLAAEFCQHLVCLVQHIALLVDCHVVWVLMAVSMQSDLMALVPDCSAILWERLEGVAGDEPCRLDVVFVVQFEQSLDTDCAGKDSCCDSQTRRLLTCWEGNLPLLMSLVESSPPYEPSHPATASMSTPRTSCQSQPLE
jgi:hypothetical protein